MNGGKLDSVNYTTARSKYLCRQAVTSTHHSGKCYRDVPLHLPSVQLHKKKCGKENIDSNVHVNM